MADIFYDVDTALAEVPVNMLPLLDATDFKTIEDAVAYNAAGMALFWHFTTTAGAYTVTAVTPTTAGNYDWTDQGTAGIYTIEIPASGGASINNDTEGFGWFTGVATGVLPWRGPVCGFRAAAINNSLIDAGTTGLLAPTVAARTLDVSAGGEAGVDWANVGSPTTAVDLSGTNIKTNQKVDVETIKTNPVVNAGTVTFPTGATLASTTNITGGTITTTTNLTNLPAAAALEATLTAMKGATYAEATDSLEALRNRGDAAWITATGFATPTNITAGTITTVTNLTNAPTAGDLTATMKTSIGTAVAASAVASVTGNVGGNVTGSVGSVVGAVGSVTGAVGSVTGNVGGNVTGTIGGLTAAALKDFFDTDSATTYASAVAGSVVKEIADNAGGSSLTAAAIADAVWDEAQADHVGAGSFGEIATEIAAILVDTAEIGTAGAGLTNINLPDQTMNITGDITGSLSGSVGSVTGAVGSVTGAVGSVTGLTASDVGAIKTKTDSLTFTVAGQVDSNVQYVNDVAVTGDGQSGTEWGPA